MESSSHIQFNIMILPEGNSINVNQKRRQSRSCRIEGIVTQLSFCTELLKKGESLWDGGNCRGYVVGGAVTQPSGDVRVVLSVCGGSLSFEHEISYFWREPLGVIS